MSIVTAVASIHAHVTAVYFRHKAPSQYAMLFIRFIAYIRRRPARLSRLALLASWALPPPMGQDGILIGGMAEAE